MVSRLHSDLEGGSHSRAFDWCSLSDLNRTTDANPAFDVVEASLAAQPVQFDELLWLRCGARRRPVRTRGEIVSRVDERVHG